MKKQGLTAAVLTSMVLATVPAFAAEDSTRLFKDWHYGQHVDEFPRSQGYYDCSGDLGVFALCHDGVTFLEYPFQGQLFFGDDNRLTHATVVADYSDDLYVTIVGALTRSFAIVSAEGPYETLDIIEQAKAGTFSSEKGMQAALVAFEAEQHRQGYFGMTLMEQEGVQEAKQDIQNAQELMMNAPEGVRVTEIAVYEDDWGPLVETSFYLPERQLGRAMEKAQDAPVEDF